MSTEIKQQSTSENEIKSQIGNYATSTKDMTKCVIYEEDLPLNEEKKLRILHFNDVYNIEESKEEPKAGASRFSTALKTFQSEEPCLLLFSGDAFSPSSCKDITFLKNIFFFRLIKHKSYYFYQSKSYS